MADDDEFLTTRLTKNEMKILKTKMKRDKIENKNQFGKKLIEDYLGIPLVEDTTSGLPLEYQTLNAFCQDLKKKLDNKQQKLLDSFLREWSSKHWHEWIDDTSERLWHADKIYDEFRVKRDVGRPVKKKRRRGRPKA